MSLLLNYNESIDKTKSDPNRIEWTDLINNSTAKIIPSNNSNNSNSSRYNELLNKPNNEFLNKPNNDFENNMLNQNIILNNKESFDSKNSTINSLQDEIRDLKKKLKFVYEKDDTIHELTVENNKLKDSLDDYDNLIKVNNKLENTNSELRRDLDNIILQLMNHENIEKENILIKKQLIKMDSEIKTMKSESNDIEVQYSVLVDKYKTLEYKYIAQTQLFEEQKGLLNNIMKQNSSEEFKVNREEMPPQQMPPQQMPPQQMPAQQMSPQQMPPQQMRPPQQMPAQQMPPQQMRPPQQMPPQQKMNIDVKKTLENLPINKEKVTINTDKNNYREIDVLSKNTNKINTNKINNVPGIQKKTLPKVTLKKKEYSSESESDYSSESETESDSEEEK